MCWGSLFLYAVRSDLDRMADSAHSITDFGQSHNGNLPLASYPPY